MRTLLRAARARRAAPPVTHEARFRIAPDDQYRQWLRHHAPGPAELDAMCRQSAGFAVRPTISIAVPVFDTPLELLRRMAESVLGQVYERWQLCLADDGSSAAHIPDELNRLCESDRRVVATRRPHNGGIAAATNSALELADGEWIAFLDHDDVLQLHALYRMVEALNSHPGADVVYSD
ncbi:MAG: glycosyltransferase [Candidatus Dormibacteraeota bacterium]|nr:glycosyltransferase [Candidatus Dormibacteraeota bacterium]